MDKKLFINEIIKIFRINNLDYNFIANKFEIYKNFLQECNQHINLTNLASDNIVWDKYFRQSIIVYRNIQFDRLKTILDVGSGSGIPGIVLKIFFPHIKLTIVDSNKKKCLFMSKLIEKLNLKNVEIICKRIESMNDIKNQFDFVTARAVTNLEAILEMTIPYATTNGIIAIPKGKKFLSEIKDLNKELNQLSAKLQYVDCIKDNNVELFTLIIKKSGKTNKKYPRVYAKILKGFDYDK